MIGKIVGYIRKRRDVQFALLCATSLVLVLLQGLLPLFLIPLQIIYYRERRRGFLLGGIAILIVYAVIRYFSYPPLEDAELARFLLTFELTVTAVVVLGLYVMIDGETIRIAGLYRYLLAVVVMWFPGVLIVPRLVLDERVVSFLQVQLSWITQSAADTTTQAIFEASEVWELLRELFLRSWLFGFALSLLIIWRLGEGVSRLMGVFPYGVADRRLRFFRMPHQLLWPLIGVWAVALATVFVEIPILGNLSWNIGFVMLFLYGLQGIGLLGYLANRFRVPRGLLLICGGMMVLLSFTPGWNGIVLIGVPILGISEYWIHYRKDNRSVEQ